MRLIEGPEPRAAVENGDGLIEHVASTKVQLKRNIML